MQEFFISFVRALRSHPALGDAHLAFCGERNSGHVIHFIEQCLDGFPNRSTVSQRGDGDNGWWTDKYNKAEQLHAAEAALELGQVRFLDGWVTAHHYAREDNAARAAKVRAQLEGELRRFGPRATTGKDGAEHEFISGRVDENGSFLGPDDLAFSFCFGIWLAALVARRRAPGVDYDKIGAGSGGNVHDPELEFGAAAPRGAGKRKLFG